MIPFLLIAAGGYLVGQSYRNQNYERGGRVLLAPNGKPSNLNPEQYKLVRTPDFKAWFGDWEKDPENSSKVIDDNGEPLVVYHGSELKFSVFSNVYNPRIQGFFFSSELSNAETYGYNIVSVFLNLINPYIIDAKGLKYTEELEVEVLAKYPNENPYLTKVKLDSDELIYLIKKGKRDNQLIEIPNREKYDGVIFKNFVDPSLTSRDRINQSTIVAFEPNQIKLADGTNTTFDDSNPDIRFDKGGNVDYTLDAICEIRTDFPEADFWLQRKGSEKTIGKPKKGYYAEDIGIKIRPEYRDQISPEYIYYSLEYLHRKGFFENMAVGSLALKNLRISDVKALPIAFGIRK